MKLPTIPLGELGDITQGVTLSRYESDQGNSCHVVTVKDLENLYVQQAQQQVRLASNIEKYQLLEGDVVIAIRGTLLKSSVISAPLQGSVTNQNTVFFRPKSDLIQPLYLAVLLRSSYFERLLSLKLHRSSTTLPAVKVSDIRALEIPLPEKETQSKIAQLFLDLEEFKQVTLSTIESRQKLSEFALLQALGE